MVMMGFLVALTFTFLGFHLGVAMSQTQPLNLDDYRWQNRIIMLFAPSAEHPDFTLQLKELAQYKTEVEERDLKVFKVFETTGSLDEHALSEEEIRFLRAQHDAVPQAFTFILVGKDGGVKRRSNSVVAAADLFAQIDSMPMRQREMREGD